MINSCLIDGVSIGNGFEPYVIAEISANHLGNKDRAINLIEAAKEAGANAVKIQTYLPDSLTIDFDGPGFIIEKGLWRGKKLYELYQEAYTPWEWHEDLFSKARELNITIFSSPFDCAAVDLLENLDCPAYKIASFEANDVNLIQYAASKGKPIIISCGVINVDEIDQAINTAKEAGATQIILLHCVSAYPAMAEDYNLRTISDMIDRFKLNIGVSDHTLSVNTSAVAVAMGACLIEKHLTLSREDGGPDAAFSLTPKEFKVLVDNFQEAYRSLGRVCYASGSSSASLNGLRRSLYATSDIGAGERLTYENIRSIRPGFGLSPSFLKSIVGKKALINIKKGTPLTLDLLSND